MRFGVLASFLLHACVVGLAFLSLPEGWRPDVAPEPYVPIEILAEADIAELTSVPAARPEPDLVEEPEPVLPAEEPAELLPEEAAPEEATPEPEPEPVPEPEPEVVEPEPTPEPEPEPEPEPVKEEPKPTPKPAPKDDELDFDSLTKVIDKAKKNERPSGAPSEVAEVADQAQRRVGAGDRLTASETAKMRAAVSRCWNASAIIGGAGT